jgi:hypothetical protein
MHLLREQSLGLPCRLKLEFGLLQDEKLQKIDMKKLAVLLFLAISWVSED